MDEERRQRKNAYNRERYRMLREQDIELARMKDREKARQRRRDHWNRINAYDRERYATNQEKVRARRAQMYAENINGFRDKALAHQRRRYTEGSITFRLSSALNAARARSAKRGIPFDLTLSDLGKPTHCAVSGIELDVTRGRKDGTIFQPSLDRIDPALGYVRGNVRVVCHGYNLAKHGARDEDVLTLALAIVERSGYRCSKA
jgi:hypothetical protein